MKVKKIIINFKDIRTALDDFVDTAEALSRGESVKQEKGIYFTSIEAFRKAITPRRLELLNIIRNSKPESIHQLASLAHRNIKNVAGDVKLLSQIGLVETRASRNRIAPEVDYDEIDLRIAFWTLLPIGKKHPIPPWKKYYKEPLPLGDDIPQHLWEYVSLLTHHKHLEKNGLSTLKKLKIDPFQLPKFANLIDISYFVAARPHSVENSATEIPKTMKIAHQHCGIELKGDLWTCSLCSSGANRLTSRRCLPLWRRWTRNIFIFNEKNALEACF